MPVLESKMWKCLGLGSAETMESETALGEHITKILNDNLK